MSDETEDQQLEEMRQQIEKGLVEEKDQAATVTQPEPQPEVSPTTAPEAQAQTPETVTPVPAQETPSADDPMEWAKKKGLTSPESMARSLQSLEDEFHRRNQAGHPGYRDIQNGNPAPPPPPPPPNWNPAPQAPAYGYPPPNGYVYPPPPPPSRGDVSKRLSEKYGIDPDDVERLMPMVVDAAEAISARRTSAMERDLSDLRRQTARSSEFVQLSQDPAFSDPRVQKEMHEVLKDGQVFQRSGSPYVSAFNIALANLARKQLQQGTIPDSTSQNNPPVTAGGGNGSSKAASFKVTPEIFERWPLADQDAYIKSNGRVLPKR